MKRPFDVSKFRNQITKSIEGMSIGYNDPKDWISTGNYALNYRISSDFKKGIPLGKVTVFAGESGSGKSYICSGNIIKYAQEQGIYVILVDTENALDEEWLKALDVDTSEEKLLKVNMAMIDDVASLISTFMKDYKAIDEEDRPKVLFVIDSIGMLMTPTEVNQFNAGDMKGDMGRKAKSLKALVTNCVNMFGNMNVGLVATNHTYASQDMFDPDDKISGGCLTAGHKVRMADGSVKNIEDILPGEVVITMDEDVEVTETYCFEDKDVYELVLSDGTTVKASAEHKFLIRSDDNEDGVLGTWTPVSEINLLSVFQLVGSTARLVSKKQIPSEPVYDICVPGAHHYILDNNLISHNSGFVYASSIVVAIRKLKLKEDENGVKTSKVHGIRASCKVMKSRYAKPFETVEVQIPWDRGMNPYSGLITMFEDMGVLAKDGNKLSYTSKKTGEIIKEFRKGWTDEKLDIIIDEWEEPKYTNEEVHGTAVPDGVVDDLQHDDTEE